MVFSACLSLEVFKMSSSPDTQTMNAEGNSKLEINFSHNQIGMCDDKVKQEIETSTTGTLDGLNIPVKIEREALIPDDHKDEKSTADYCSEPVKYQPSTNIVLNYSEPKPTDCVSPLPCKSGGLSSLSSGCNATRECYLVEQINNTQLQDKPQRITCCHCEYSCKTNKDLKRHIKCKHSKGKPFTCNLCDYSCKSIAMLKTHLSYKHSDERPFFCTSCDFSCKTSSVLKQHFKFKHSEEKPFTCSLCDYCCKTSGALKRHRQTKHSQERPFTCTFCNYSSKMNSDLKKHIKYVHCKEKPFTCTFCVFSCIKKQTLIFHIKYKHMNEKPLTCSSCDYSACDPNVLKRHIMKKH